MLPGMNGKNSEFKSPSSSQNRCNNIELIRQQIQTGEIDVLEELLEEGDALIRNIDTDKKFTQSKKVTKNVKQQVEELNQANHQNMKHISEMIDNFQQSNLYVKPNTKAQVTPTITQAIRNRNCHHNRKLYASSFDKRIHQRRAVEKTKSIESDNENMQL